MRGLFLRHVQTSTEILELQVVVFARASKKRQGAVCFVLRFLRLIVRWYVPRVDKVRGRRNWVGMYPILTRNLVFLFLVRCLIPLVSFVRPLIPAFSLCLVL